MPIHGHFFQRVILTGKVGQTDLVFGMLSEFISRSLRARLQVSVCSGCTHIDSILTSLYEKFNKLANKTEFQSTLDHLRIYVFCHIVIMLLLQ